jgi:hypothetical protein
MAGAFAGKVLVPVTVPIGEPVMLKLAVQLVTKPLGGVPETVWEPKVTVPVSLNVPRYGPVAGPVAR